MIQTVSLLEIKLLEKLHNEIKFYKYCPERWTDSPCFWLYNHIKLYIIDLSK